MNKPADSKVADSLSVTCAIARSDVSKSLLPDITAFAQVPEGRAATFELAGLFIHVYISSDGVLLVQLCFDYCFLLC